MIYVAVSGGDDEPARGFLQQRRDLSVGQARLAKLPKGLVAREDEEQGERPLPADPFFEPSRAVQVANESYELAAAVGALAVDEIPGGRIDGGDTVELSKDRVFGGPEADAVGDRLGERCDGIRTIDDRSQLDERGILGKGLADRIHELEPGAEVLVERRPRHARPLGDLLHGRVVEPALGEQLSDCRLDLLARGRRT